jgi:ribose/xylose/arabinose/galactoside ABC-type transport system permease subunit
VTPSEVRPKPLQRLRRALAAPGGQGAVVVTLLAIVVITAIGNPRFLGIQNILNVLLQISILGIVSVGQTVLLISAGLDLSVGAMLSVSALAGGLVIHATGSTLVGVAVALATALLIGTINGLLAATGRAHPFIITLGTMTLLQGVAIVISRGSPINGMGKLYDIFGIANVLGVPTPVYLLALALGSVALVLRFAPLGRYAFAVGGNEEAARLSGLPIFRIKVSLYALNGLLVGVAAIALSGILDSALPAMGTGYELRAVAAVVIGGTPLFGGRGSVWGTLFGVLLLGLVSNSINLLGIGANLQYVVLGAIITAAVMFQRSS